MAHASIAFVIGRANLQHRTPQLRILPIIMFWKI